MCCRTRYAHYVSAETNVSLPAKQDFICQRQISSNLVGFIPLKTDLSAHRAAEINPRIYCLWADSIQGRALIPYRNQLQIPCRFRGFNFHSTICASCVSAFHDRRSFQEFQRNSFHAQSAFHCARSALNSTLRQSNIPYLGTWCFW